MQHGQHATPMQHGQRATPRQYGAGLQLDRPVPQEDDQLLCSVMCLDKYSDIGVDTPQEDYLRLYQASAIPALDTRQVWPV